MKNLRTLQSRTDTILCCFKASFLFVLIFSVRVSNAQELFPVAEPASTIPKGVIGLRATAHVHYSAVGHREMVRLMYGVTPTVTSILTTTASNMHVKSFPSDLNAYYKVYHNHQATQSFYPYSLEGFHLFTKWRFLNFDGQNKHLRFALYNELSYSNVAHVDAFPNLLGDNSGVALGLISTKLYKKLAVSVTSGYTRFMPYTKNASGEKIKFQAGDAVDLNLSIGYLIYPRRYTSYKNLNVNLYLELLNKFYDGATISRDGIYINTEQFQYLRRGSLGFVCPGVQFIINSKTRLDIVTQHPLFQSNNIDQYPMLKVNLQHYFF